MSRIAARHPSPTPGTETSPKGSVAIRGARTHNLRSVNLDIPHDALTVITGVSGSGKSSLAFDTLFAEGQRQYVDSLSPFARQFVDALPRPELDSIAGLQPTLCIDQSRVALSSRSTVATVAEIYDYLRLLMARIGIPHCFRCEAAIAQQSPDEIVERLASLPQGTRLHLMAPMVRGKKGSHQEIFARMSQRGLLRARVDGEIVEIENLPPLDPKKNHTIEAVCDRLIIRDDVRERMLAAIQLALRMTDGLVIAAQAAPVASGTEPRWEDQVFSTKYACPKCGVSLSELEPRIFSFNSPYGACPECGGTGSAVSRKEPYADREAVNEERLGDEWETPCPACQGKRLRPESMAVRLEGRSIDQITSLTLEEAREWFHQLSLDGLRRSIAAPILEEMLPRIDFLCQVGVGYVTLDRPAKTLSGGEWQRVRLATSLGSGLVGVCYILDEPSIGLHPSDDDRLIEVIRRLRDRGNTLVVVEHDEAMIRAADHLVDMGPGAGPHGGTILASGTVAEVTEHCASITGSYLRGEKRIPIPTERRKASSDPNSTLSVFGAKLHHLKAIDVHFPLGCLVGVTGVSGSGKSSLMIDTLAKAVRWGLANPNDMVRGPFAAVKGIENLQRIVAVDQQAIGQNARSTPSTYTGIWDEIRQVYSQTRDAKQRGYQSNRFSFNAGPGRCEQCQGQGRQKLEMHFLADVYTTCTRCGGERFNRSTLAVRYRDKTIADILRMSVSEAADFFRNFSKIGSVLDALEEIGLGYLLLGQPSNTLSGGEAQRVKLAAELAIRSTAKTLYILDEPTTGLHFDDIRRLLRVLHGLVDRGNTVVLIEHQLDVLRNCDWLIELGPTGGPKGGYLLAAGSPEQIARCAASPTAPYLRKGYGPTSL